MRWAALWAGLLAGLVACARPASAPPPSDPAPCVAAGEASSASITPPDGLARAATPPPEGGRLGLTVDAPLLALPSGRWAVLAKVPPESYVTLGIRGPRDAIERFDVMPPSWMRRLRAQAKDTDGRLPAFISFETRQGEEEVMVVVDAAASVELFLHAVPTSASLVERDRRRAPPPTPLVGLPAAVRSSAGYFLQHPHRYQFLRADVARALLEAFQQTRVRTRRGPLGIGDITQWNGRRPATDLGHPRHISHEGGRDVDFALPAEKGASVIEPHCDGVLTDEGVLRCAPGTVRNFDAKRLAYFLALLIDGPTPGGRFVGDADLRPGPYAEVEVIFTDQSYIDAVRRELDGLRQRRWIHDEAYGALGEEGLLRASPWHVDHVHVRFVGPSAKVAPVLDFDPTPGKGEAKPDERDPVGAQ